MTRLRHRRNWAVCGLVVLALVLVVLSLGELRGYHYRTLGKEYAMWAVGQAALDYLRDTGVAPEGVNDLIEAGLLEYEGGWLKSPENKYHGAPATAARGVRLSVPAAVDAYILRGDMVVHRDTGQPVIIVASDGVPADRQARVNRELGSEWWSIVAPQAERRDPNGAQP